VETETESANVDGEFVVALRGSCEEADARHIRRVVDDALATAARTIVVDLHGATYFSEHCLGALLGIHRAASAHGVAVRLRDPSPACRRKLEVTGIDRLFLEPHRA
jgi:anti-sigma B factor antagonist